VTGYPWNGITTAEHKRFLDAYQKKFNDYPRLGSIVGYSAIMSIAAGIRKANSTNTEKLIEVFHGLNVDTPLGPIRYRAQDNQSTMGAYVGRIAVKEGKGVMVNYQYLDGAKFQPADSDIKQLRKAP
jgi:branched-chain amino acid transport system substrate-binding protein